MKVLIIEDDPDIVESLAMFFELKWDGATVISAKKGEKGIELARVDSPDVIILDLGLPDMDGFEVLRQIRNFSNVPIIILTARNEEIDKVKGFELGADDYITKPFSPAEFLARVQAMLRRSTTPEELSRGEKHFAIGKMSVDYNTREVSIANKPVKLTPSEHRLLCELAAKEGEVLSNQILLVDRLVRNRLTSPRV